ncbi:MAG TPA: septal ring lytic transglycosylase RlpA family protein [Solirubrobacterales bacterium]|nr:septal ring lytic transglycosylase RlpA family protein [Solirubrobacterales bacterium]
MAVVSALSIGIAPAAATKSHHHQPKRVRSHVSLHLSGHTVLNGNGIAVHGKVRPSGRHRVKLVFRGTDAGVVTTTTKGNGAFAVRWLPERTGNYTVRAFGIHGRDTRGAVSVARRLTSYRYAGASYYGPGLYGNGVACGGTLMPGTMGVANKTLPCGTKVKLRYRGRTVTVPVIDRGPYIAGRDYDLTEAVKERLGFPGVGTVLANR